MYNVYSPTIQNMYGISPGPVPAQIDFMNPPVPPGPGDYNPAIQTSDPGRYNYGPIPGQPPPVMDYQQQMARDQKAWELKQELGSPFLKIDGYQGAVPQYNPMVYGGYQQPTTRTIQGFNILGISGIQSIDTQKEEREMNEYYANQARKDMDSRYGAYNNSYNYYGNFNTNYINPDIVSEYQAAKQSYEAEATQNRIDMNKRIARMAHNGLGDLDEKQIDRIYDDRRVPLPYVNYQEQMEETRLCNMVDVGQAKLQQIQQGQKKVTDQHNAMIPPDSNLVDMFENAWKILYEEKRKEMERNQKNRDIYSDKEFKGFIGSQLERREGGKNAFQALMETFPEAKDIFNANTPNGMSMLEDGTVKISAADRFKDTVVVEPQNQNANQADYMQQRAKFVNSIYNGGGTFI